MKSLNTGMQAIKFEPNCFGQAHFKRPGIGPAYEITEPGCMLTVLRVSFTPRPTRNADAKSSKVI